MSPSYFPAPSHPAGPAISSSFPALPPRPPLGPRDASAALQSWLVLRAAPLVVPSALPRAEVCRAVRRNNHTDSGALIDPEAFEAELAQAVEVLDAIAHIAIDDAILHRAGATPSRAPVGAKAVDGSPPPLGSGSAQRRSFVGRARAARRNAGRQLPAGALITAGNYHRFRAGRAVCGAAPD